MPGTSCAASQSTYSHPILLQDLLEDTLERSEFVADGLASGGLASGGLASGDLASGDLASGDLASGDLASGDLASGDLASGDLASGDLASDDLVKDGLAKGSLVSRELASVEPMSVGSASNASASKAESSSSALVPADDLRDFMQTNEAGLLDAAFGVPVPCFTNATYAKKRARVTVVCKCGASGAQVKNCGGATRETVLRPAKYKHHCTACGRRWLRSRDPLQDGSYEETESLFAVEEERLARPLYMCGKCGQPKKGHSCNAFESALQQESNGDTASALGSDAFPLAVLDGLGALHASEALDAPDICTPALDVRAPDVCAPDICAPALDVRAPDVCAPDIYTPAPNVRAPDIYTPAPNVRAPDIYTPAPDVGAPDLCAPDLCAPDLCAPDVREPDVREPDVREPDVREPDVREPDVREPDVREPDLCEPDVRKPDVRAPDVRAPDVRAPDVRAPDVRAPDVRAPAPNIADSSTTSTTTVAPSTTRDAVSAAQGDSAVTATECMQELGLRPRVVRQTDGSNWVYALLACCGLYQSCSDDVDLPPTPRDRGMDRFCRQLAWKWITSSCSDLHGSQLDAVHRIKDTLPNYPITSVQDRGAEGTIDSIAGIAAHCRVNVVLWDNEAMDTATALHAVSRHTHRNAHGTSTAHAAAVHMQQMCLTAAQIRALCKETVPTLHIRRSVAGHYVPLVGHECVQIHHEQQQQLLQCLPVTALNAQAPRICSHAPTSSAQWQEFKDVYRTDFAFTKPRPQTTHANHLRAALRTGHQGVLYVSSTQQKAVLYCKIAFGPIDQSVLARAGDLKTTLYIHEHWNNSRHARRAPLDDGASCDCNTYYMNSTVELQCTKCLSWHHATCALPGPFATVSDLEARVATVEKTWRCRKCE
jgi:hypothetical protein